MIAQFPYTPLSDTFWFAMGVAATLLYAYITNRTGRYQISFLRKAHDLNVKLAECQIGSRCAIGLQSYHPERPDIRRYVVTTAIYNAGDLAARHLKGQWKLSCSDSVYNHASPIWIDFVSKATPSELKPYSFSSNEITQAIMRGEVRIKVEIEFDFIGLSEDQPKHYDATYQYDHQQKQLIRI